MGTHFDPDLAEAFKACFPSLKEYYAIETQRE
jgi:hypothetical protein